MAVGGRFDLIRGKWAISWRVLKNIQKGDMGPQLRTTSTNMISMTYSMIVDKIEA